LYPNDDRVTGSWGISTGVSTGPAIQRNNRRFTAAATVTATTTSGSPNLTAISNMTTPVNWTAGMMVSGPGIPAGTTLLSVNIGASSAVMSNNATASASGVTVTPAKTLTYTIPSGKSITRLRFISGNRATETGVVSAWKNGVAAGSITSANNDTPSYTEFACTDGDVFVFADPPSSALTCLGLEIRTAQTHGVPVHRMGRQGYTIANLIGGIYNGLIGSPDGSTVLTAAQIAAEIRACYKWANPSPGFVFVLPYGTNENTKQLLATGIDCGLVPSLFRLVADIVIKQVTADGGIVVLLSPCPSPTENTANGAAPLSAYAAMLYSLAVGSAKTAMVDVASSATWGGGFSGLDATGRPIEVDDATKAAAIAAAASAGLRDPNSSHPTASGYQSYADLVYAALVS
jgi:hypothetical protein